MLICNSLLYSILIFGLAFGCQSAHPEAGNQCGFDADSIRLRTWTQGEVDEDTTVRFRCRADAIDVRFDCVDGDIDTPFVGRDSDLYKGDVVELFIDPAGDGRTIIEIQVNPNNDVLDLRLKYDPARQLTDTGRLTEDSVRKHFDSDRAFTLSDLETAAGRSTNGYWIELRVQLEELRRAAGLKSIDSKKMRWNVVRLDRRSDGSMQASSLVRVDPGCQHISPDRARLICTSGEADSNGG